ncbi:retron system putative HNH endonuclease [Ketobacter sp.]|uniref:retron system putative HNH endonuclease n=1 Tax=Ketobacter sp. TaxID=2083498 RepID=UPI0025BE605F|nr:retron system putative HNH endonuclease [Ketobacter sp.]
MKKIFKSPGPNALTEFAGRNPNENWDSFRAENAGNSYKEILMRALGDQGFICGYCELELNVESFPRPKIEHFHPKCDTSNAEKNWSLDWNNVFVVCAGGEQADKKLYPTPANLSCDAHKNYLDTLRKILIPPEGQLLNPLDMLECPCLFSFNKGTGELGVAEFLTMEDERYDLVDNTLKILNLNCERLKSHRREVLKSYNREIKKARMSGDADFHSKLAERWFRKKWPSFFTTRRLLLGKHAEEFLYHNE